MRNNNKGLMECQHHNTCLYCDSILSSGHEHDHAPIPARHGGGDVFCVCVNCHDLKDRNRLTEWPINGILQVMNDWQTMSPLTRIFIAKCAMFVLDKNADEAEQEDAPQVEIPEPSPTLASKQYDLFDTA